VVSDEPDVGGRLNDVVTRLAARHDVMWAMVADLPAVGAGEGDQHGYDVGTGRFILNASTLGDRVIAAYRRAEQNRASRLAEFMAARAIPSTTVAGSGEIRRRLVEMTEVFARAG
jgi:hypothetical protein